MSKLKYKNGSRARRAAALSGFLCLITAACSASMTDSPRATYRENPTPTQAHRLTLTIADAPGPLEVTVSAVQYDVVNTECLPPPKDNPGGYSSPVPTYDIPVELERVSDTEYTGVFYTDGMLDDDYHGRGVCQWAFIQMQVQLTAPGTEGATKFIASLGREQVDTTLPKRFFYARIQYPHAGMESYPDSGHVDPESFAPDVRDALFSLTLAAKEAKQ